MAVRVERIRRRTLAATYGKLLGVKEKEMTERKNPQDPRDSGGPNHSQEPNEPFPVGERPNSEGREHEVHQEILARRMRGGREPTLEAYARALEQWKNLPGSVVRPPTDVSPPPAEEPSEPTDQGSPNPPKP